MQTSHARNRDPLPEVRRFAVERRAETIGRMRAVLVAIGLVFQQPRPILLDHR